jgi:hypothetical protein
VLADDPTSAKKEVHKAISRILLHEYVTMREARSYSLKLRGSFSRPAFINIEDTAAPAAKRSRADNTEPAPGPSHALSGAPANKQAPPGLLSAAETAQQTGGFFPKYSHREYLVSQSGPVLRFLRVQTRYICV